jgi:predicted membrane protein
MFSNLKNKWKVNWFQFTLIICTFAFGGSLCGYAGRKILSVFAIDKNLLYYILYVLIVTVLWPISVLLVSIPLGQFSFFKSYIKKIGKRMFGK